MNKYAIYVKIGTPEVKFYYANTDWVTSISSAVTYSELHDAEFEANRLQCEQDVRVYLEEIEEEAA